MFYARKNLFTAKTKSIAAEISDAGTTSILNKKILSGEDANMNPGHKMSQKSERRIAIETQRRLMIHSVKIFRLAVPKCTEFELVARAVWRRSSQIRNHDVRGLGLQSQ
jgi:hypothetical protein